MDTAQARTVEQAAQRSSISAKTYVENPNSRDAKSRALADAKNLCVELQDGDDMIFTRLEQVAAAYALRFVMQIGAFDKIPRGGSISSRDLAKAVGSDESLITRFFRLLCATGILQEVHQDYYAHTRRSLILLETGYGYFYEFMMDEFLTETMGKLGDYYKSHELRSPYSPTRNPYSWAHGMEGQNWFHVMGRKPDQLRKFAIATSIKLSIVPAVGIYPFDTELQSLSNAAVEQDRVFMVDIGGNQGATMKEIREVYPSLKGKIIVQDTAQVVDTLPEDFLPEEYNIEARVHDFWTPQPVKNATVYYLRRIMHDWPDALCLKILQQTVAAMGPDSKLLIAENVVPDHVSNTETYCYWIDMIMMMFAGKERSNGDWRTLFDRLGIELVKVWKAKEGSQAVIEGRLKRTH